MVYVKFKKKYERKKIKKKNRRKKKLISKLFNLFLIFNVTII